MKEKKRHLHRFLLLVCFFLLSSTFMVIAQQQRITVKVSNATIGSVIQSLKTQTGLDFFYSNAQIDVNRRVTLDLENVRLDEAVRKLLGDRFSFEYSGNMVIVTPAKSITISGTIKDTDGQPIVGASIYVKNQSRIGTISDINGNYKLVIPNVESLIIVVAFIGMETQEFTPTKQIYDIVLKEALNQLTEVMVTVSTGYQDIPRERMTGAYSVVTAKDLENSNFISIDQALQGKVPGLFSVTPSGEPGVQSEIRIRGDNSISGNREPLWIVDGLPLQQGVATISGLTSGSIQESILNHGVGNIAPSDIESVTVLKDAAATAIYGARAAAGVIVVKTKRGGEGPVSINYQGSFSIGEAPKQQMNFMNSSQKVAFEIEIAEEFDNIGRLGGAARAWNSWQRGDISTAEYQQKINEMSAVNTNWFNEIFRTSFSHKHNISMRGGSNKMWFYASVNITDDQAILKQNRYNVFSASTNIGFRPVENVAINFHLSGTYRESNNHNSAIDPFQYAVFANPYEKPYNDDGTYAYDQSYFDDLSELHDGVKYNFNILKEMDKNRKKSNASDLSATISLDWQINEQLKAEAYGRIGYSVSQNEQYADKGTYTSAQNYLLKSGAFGSSAELPDLYNRGYISGGTSKSPSYSFRAGASYNQDFNAQHYLNAYIGTEVRSSESWSNSFRTATYDHQYYFVGFPEFTWDIPFDKTIWSSVSNMSKYVYGNKNRYVSFFGSLTYSYQDRYVANFNARLDGASAMHDANNFTPLWSASVRWNLQNESFIKDNLPFISELAIRGVYGFTGQIDINALPYPYILLTSSMYDSEYMAGTLNHANPGIKWEKKRDRSIGIDYSLFNNVFGGSINYYNNKTKDLLDRSSVANSFGNTSPRRNKGSLTNKGFEFHFNLRLRPARNVRWTTSFNISRNINKITDTYYKGPASYNDNTTMSIWAGYTGAVEGYPVGATFGYKFAGVDPATGNAMVYINDMTRQKIAEHQEVDVSEILNYIDVEAMPTSYRTDIRYSMEVIGYRQPKYHGGFNTNVTWKDLEVKASFSYATNIIAEGFNERRFVYDARNRTSELYSCQYNRLVKSNNRWRAPGDITDVPRYSADGSVHYYMTTSDKYEKAGYLKFQDISVNYTIKSACVKSIGMNSMRIGLQVQNVAVWSKFTGFDASTGSAFAYPLQRRYMLNLLMSF